MEQLIRYQLDSTGRNPDNLIKGERHILKDMRFRAISPFYGAFFGDSVRLVEEKTGRELVRNKDYVTAEVLVDKTELTGQSVNGVILVTNLEVDKNVLLDYQCLGGYSERNNQSIENLLKVEHDDYISNSFIDIANRPETFKPTFHLHSLDDIHGFEYITYLLESLRNAIFWKNADFIYDLIDKVDNELVASMDFSNDAAEESLSRILSDFRNLFKKEKYDLGKVRNYRTTTPSELIDLANGKKIIYSNDGYIGLRAISYFKETLYGELLSKKETGLGLEYGLIGIPTKEFFMKAPNGSRFFIDSHDIAEKTNQVFDLTVFPDITATKTKFSIYKVSNFVDGTGGVFLATNLKTAITYTGRIKEYGSSYLLEWKQIFLTNKADDWLLDIIGHLGDDKNPHKDTKESVGLEEVENLAIATKEDVLTQRSVRRYLTADNLQLYMKGFMAGRPDDNIIEPDKDINVMRRFDIVFSDCGDDFVGNGSRICTIEELEFTFNVYTQRPRYRNFKILTERPELAKFDPIIYEGYSKLNGNSLTTDRSTRTGIRLLNLTEILSISQSWSFGTLYQGFRSGVFDYETTDPYYDTYLVVRGAKATPTMDGAIEVKFIKSYETLVDELGSIDAVNEEYEFQMKKGDFLLCFRAFNRPPENWTEEQVLEFEKIEQRARINIYSTGYAFQIDMRTAVFLDYNFVTLKEKNSPKIVPAIHYPEPPTDWFIHKRLHEGEDTVSTVIVGNVTSNDKKLEIKAAPGHGVNTLVDNFKTKPRRPGYVNGTLGMSVINLINDGVEDIRRPTDIDDITRDEFYGGIVDEFIDNDKATVLFWEQLNLGKTINYNIYQDQFLNIESVIRPRPYSDFNFKNPYANGNLSTGNTKKEAFYEFMRLGFNRLNSPDSLTKRLNSSKGHLTVEVVNPNNPNEVFTVTLGEKQVFNREIFELIYENYIANPERVKNWGQPEKDQPYCELLEIPKTFVNTYKGEYKIVNTGTDEGRILELTNEPDPNNIVIEVAEVARYETEKICAAIEPVYYNGLMNSAAIVKNWRFKGIYDVVKLGSYMEGTNFPVYEDYNLDKSPGLTSKVVTFYTVLDIAYSRKEKYENGLFDCKSFTAVASCDRQRREITIQLAEELHEEVLAEMYSYLAEEENFKLTNEEFKTFDIMYGVYDKTNKLTYDKDKMLITIDMSHRTVVELDFFFRHHFKYIEWSFDLELVPTVFTSVPYPVIFEDSSSTSFSFVDARTNNFAQYTKPEEHAKVDYEVLSVDHKRVVYETRFEDAATYDFEFLNAYFKKFYYYKRYGEDHAAMNYELIEVSVRTVVQYIVYPNYVPELTKCDFELMEISVKKVRID